MIKLSFLFIIFSALILNAQKLDDPLNPIKVNKPQLQDLGLTIGFGQNYSNGEHLVECEGCIFSGGVGFGTTIGLYYEREATEWFWYGALIRYDNLGIESKYIENESTPVEGSNKTFIIPFEHVAQTELSYLNFTPYISIRPFQWFRFNSGLNIGANISSNLRHTKTPVSNQIIDPETGDILIVETTNPDPNRTGKERYTIMDDDFPELSSPYFTLFFDFKFPIELENESKIIPSFGFDLPITDISNYGNNFNIGTWRLFLSYSYPLITRGKTPTN